MYIFWYPFAQKPHHITSQTPLFIKKCPKAIMLLSSRRLHFHQAFREPLSLFPSLSWTLSDSVAETRWLIISPPCRTRTPGVGTTKPAWGHFTLLPPHNPPASTPPPQPPSPFLWPLTQVSQVRCGRQSSAFPPICFGQTDEGLAERNLFFGSICGSSLFSLPCLSLNAIVALVARARRKQELLGVLPESSLHLKQQTFSKHLFGAA